MTQSFKVLLHILDIMSALQNLSYAAMNHDGITRMWLGHILYFGKGKIILYTK